MAGKNTNTEEKLMKCTKCDFTSKRASSLKNHIKAHNFGRKLLKCNFENEIRRCTFSCSKAETLKQHWNIHTLNAPYLCTKDKKCYFKGLRKVDQKRHAFRHTTEKQMKCKECMFSCTRNIVMKSHIKVHSENKQSNKLRKGSWPWRCPTCMRPSSSCRDKPCLKDFRFKCQNCGSSWCRDNPCPNLSIYVKKTSSLKCSECDYNGSTMSNLKRHMKTHTREKPFKCEACDYTASRADHMKKHMKRKMH